LWVGGRLREYDKRSGLKGWDAREEGARRAGYFSGDWVFVFKISSRLVCVQS
jgi:hypothetical protein